jgi:hypothetical protein
MYNSETARSLDRQDKIGLLTGSFPKHNCIDLPLRTHFIISSMTLSAKAKLKISGCTKSCRALQCSLSSDKPDDGIERAGMVPELIES